MCESHTVRNWISRDEFFLMRGEAKLTNQRPVLMKLRLRKNNINADKNRRNFFWIFLGFSRGLPIKRRRLSYRLTNLVVWELQQKSLIQNQNSTMNSKNFFEYFVEIFWIVLISWIFKKFLISGTKDENFNDFRRKFRENSEHVEI